MIKTLFRTLVFAALLSQMTSAHAYDRKFVGRFNDVDWWIEPYTGQQPGPGIITFNLIERSATGVNNQPLFIKCNTSEFSASYLAYQRIPAGVNLVRHLYSKYC